MYLYDLFLTIVWPVSILNLYYNNYTTRKHFSSEQDQGWQKENNKTSVFSDI